MSFVPQMDLNLGGGIASGYPGAAGTATPSAGRRTPHRKPSDLPMARNTAWRTLDERGSGLAPRDGLSGSCLVAVNLLLVANDAAPGGGAEIADRLGQGSPPAPESTVA